MSTRGFITFVIDGTEKTAYNHFDSYPDGLGLNVLKWLRSGPVDPEAVRALRVASRDSRPSDEDIERLRKWSWDRHQHGGTQDLRDGQEWYDLLHETMGEPALMLEAGVIEDAHGFPQESLFAEWGYVIDLDAGRYEVYEGFQRSRHHKGRFADRAPVDGYYPVALVASWPLSDLPADDASEAGFAGDGS